MSCCDYCSPGPIAFCGMCGTPDGNAQHWEYITLWGLQGCFPCDYKSCSYEWILMTDKWFIDQTQAHAVNLCWQEQS